MSDELQAEIDRLKEENGRLAAQAVDLHDQIKEVRTEAKDRRHENKALTAQVAELTADRDGWKSKAEAEPNALQARVDELTGKIRERDHRDAFGKVAGALKVSDPARQADLWALSGYKPESDAPDESRITATIQGALKGRSWLVDVPEPDGSTTAPGGANGASATPRPAVPGPGADRGQSVSSPTSQPATRVPGRI
jgi:FtsZ-binding cell division protein ZapB